MFRCVLLLVETWEVETLELPQQLDLREVAGGKMRGADTFWVATALLPVRTAGVLAKTRSATSSASCCSAAHVAARSSSSPAIASCPIASSCRRRTPRWAHVCFVLTAL